MADNFNFELNIEDNPYQSDVVISAGIRGEKGEKGEKGDKGDTGDDSVIPGPQGDDGIAVELQNDGTNINWRYVGDASWNLLIALVDIKGDQGIQGIPGEPVELQLSPTHVQWKYASDEAWADLISIAEITGPQGVQGIPGVDGVDGEQGVQGLPGIPGTPIEVQNDSTYIQWRYVGSVDWINLVALIDLTGLQGVPGVPGVDGEEILLQKTSTHIQWKYTSDVTWTDLVALSEITGTQGLQGIQGEDGIQGLKGDNGNSAYQSWLAAGNTGTEQEFLDSLKTTEYPKVVRSDKDSDGVFKVVSFFDESNNLRKKSTLSGSSSHPYIVRTEEYFDETETLINTIVYDIVYDAEEDLISETAR